MGKHRGVSPPRGDWGFNKEGEGAGHEVKKHKKSGYARSTHMDGLAGPRKVDGGEGRTPKGLVHTGFLNTSETKEHGSGHKLPMEKNVPFRKGIDPGDHFEDEIKEHFPSKKGVAGIHSEAMPHKNSPIEVHDEGGHGHVSGKAEHHPSMGKAHSFRQPMEGAHSFGHDNEQRKGFLRLSGKKGAHQVGKR
jgi:hypothetical protein